MVTIPRAEINVIAEKYGDFFGLDEDPPAEYIRAVAADYRRNAGDTRLLTPDESADFRAEANDLDALVDRYEKAANA